MSARLINQDRDKVWYLHGKLYNFDEWLELTNISDETTVMMKLQYG